MITAYAFVGDRLEPLPAEQLALLRTLPPHVVWIDLLSPTAEEEQRVEQLAAISLPTREEMEEIEVSARLYQEDGAEFMTMTAVTRMDSEEPITSAITFALKHSALITLRYADTRAFTNVVTRALKPHGIPCADGEQVMLALIEALCDRVADALENVGRDIDSLSRGIFRRRVEEKASVTTQDLQRTIRRIGQDGDLLTKVRESLVSVNRVLTYHTTLDHGEKRTVRDAKIRTKSLYRDVVALTDQATFLSSKVDFLLDATLGLINLQQNQIIKIFSVAAVVFLPPTLVASSYGMNFEFIPELTWRYGYLWALAVMVASAVVPYWYFKRRGWL